MSRESPQSNNEWEIVILVSLPEKGSNAVSNSLGDFMVSWLEPRGLLMGGGGGHWTEGTLTVGLGVFSESADLVPVRMAQALVDASVEYLRELGYEASGRYQEFDEAELDAFDAWIESMVGGDTEQ